MEAFWRKQTGRWQKSFSKELFEEAKAQNYASIDCIMGNNFPQVAGVTYDQDFFGGSLAKGKPDIGAAEYQSKEPENQNHRRLCC